MRANYEAIDDFLSDQGERAMAKTRKPPAAKPMLGKTCTTDTIIPKADKLPLFVTHSAAAMPRPNMDVRIEYALQSLDERYNNLKLRGSITREAECQHQEMQIPPVGDATPLGPMTVVSHIFDTFISQRHYR